MACSAGHRTAIGLDALLFGRQLAFRALDRCRQIVGLHHQLEDAIFERLDFALREADLLLDRRVFLIGLDRHRLFPELRKPALVDGDVLLDRAPGVLVFG